MCRLVLVLMSLVLSISRVEPLQLMRLELLSTSVPSSVFTFSLSSLFLPPTSLSSVHRLLFHPRSPVISQLHHRVWLKSVVLHPSHLPLPSEHGRIATKKGSTPTKLNAISSGFAPSLITDIEPSPSQWQQQVLKRPLLLKWVCRTSCVNSMIRRTSHQSFTLARCPLQDRSR